MHKALPLVMHGIFVLRFGRHWLTGCGGLLRMKTELIGGGRGGVSTLVELRTVGVVGMIRLPP